jgi:predicted dehydrogenase
MTDQTGDTRTPARDHRQAKSVVGLEGEILSVIPIRIGIVGCGGHMYRNVLPLLRNIPEAEIVAVCDLNIDKARLYAEAAGGTPTAYPDVETMLDAGGLDAAIVVVGFDDITGEPLYPGVVEQILRRRVPTWLEKPPAADAAGVQRMIDAAEAGNTFAQVGFKKVFSVGVQRLHEITRLPSFGRITSYTYSYDVDLPAVVGDLSAPDGRRFLDDFVHIASVIERVIGVPAAVQATRGVGGAGVIVNRHTDGTLGTINLSKESSGLSPVERFEVVGTGTNAVLENGATLTYYPQGNRGPYGTSTNFLPPVTEKNPPDFGPRRWEPEFSLGNLHGGSHFIQGYYQQLRYFVDCVATSLAPELCSLRSAHNVMNYMDTLVGPFNVWRPVPGQKEVAAEHHADPVQELDCPQCSSAMTMKDGWNYVCRTCGTTVSGQIPRSQQTRNLS